MPKTKKVRLDVLLVERGFVESREKAQALIMSGKVSTTDRRLEKPGTKLDESIPLHVQSSGQEYVSRAAHKLLGAITKFNIKINGLVCLDVGASTGGFTEVCLLNGAQKVFAVDVGHNQLHWKLRSDPRVKSFEGVNFRDPTTQLVSQSMDGTGIAPIDFCCIDTSFISLKLILPSVLPFLNRSRKSIVVALIKPQHEVGRENVGKGGLVLDEKLHKMVVDEISNFSKGIGFQVEGVMESPIQGTTGNKEFLIYLIMPANL